MPSGHVHPSDDVAYLSHLLVEVPNGAPTEQSVLHHPAWKSKVGGKGRQRERNLMVQVIDPGAGWEGQSKEAGRTEDGRWRGRTFLRQLL